MNVLDRQAALFAEGDEGGDQLSSPSAEDAQHRAALFRLRHAVNRLRAGDERIDRSVERDFDDGLTSGHQPLGERPTESLSTRDRPAPPGKAVSPPLDLS